MDSENSIQYAMIKDVVSSLKNGKPFNLPRLLEILNSSTDIDVQVKLFSTLSAYLMLNVIYFNDDNIAAIITYNPIYDKICKILTNCPPRKSTVAFNFLSALLYVNDEDSHRKNSLISYARNMIRSSGCLATMCELFTTCMMHQDAWRALCRCLAESCRGVEANQSYCTHLVPMCIQKCSQRNIEVMSVLQSLLHQHNRNIALFLECNGIELFQREFLQHEICLQLLATIVQSSTEAAALIANADTCRHLRDFLQMYGPQSQLGQWATIVLYHTSRLEGKNHSILSNNTARLTSSENPKVKGVQRENNKLNESLLAKLHPAEQNRQKESSADTTKFFQDVMKEILQCGAHKEFNNLKAFFPPEILTNNNQNNTVNYASKIPFNEISQRNTFRMTAQNSYKFNGRNNKVTTIQHDIVPHNKPYELSFSFLRQQNLHKKQIAKNFVTADVPESLQTTFQTNENRVRKNTVYESLMEIDESRLNTLATDDFNPQFASTPKKNVMKYQYSRYENPCSSNNYSIRSIQKSVRNQKKKRQLEKKKLSKRLERSKNIDKDMKHKSFSGRFFDAINTSCTTLVKTVKNIFRPKSDLHDTENNTENDSLDETPNQDTLSCSYSFTNYMRKRDAAIKNECANHSGEGLIDRKPKEKDDFSMDMSNSCNTCNNTIALRRKLVSDEHLKQTIRKLKLGINLYGCNFKKISRTMWPNENYMTPAILYNLYRKLIVK